MRTLYPSHPDAFDALPTREAMRAPHKSRHGAPARFTTRKPAGGAR